MSECSFWLASVKLGTLCGNSSISMPSRLTRNVRKVRAAAAGAALEPGRRQQHRQYHLKLWGTSATTTTCSTQRVHGIRPLQTANVGARQPRFTRCPPMSRAPAFHRSRLIPTSSAAWRMSIGLPSQERAMQSGVRKRSYPFASAGRMIRNCVDPSGQQPETKPLRS
jgi:hypothetical protein